LGYLVDKMADTAPTYEIQVDYQTGYKDGLAAGFEQGLLAAKGPEASQGPSNARKVAAWFVLSAGLLGAGGVLMTSRREGVGLGTTVIVGSAIMTSLITSLQILSNRSGPRL
jgi:hypothetical protein